MSEPSQRVPLLAAVLRLDMYDSTTAVHKGEMEFLAFMELLLRQVDKDIYPSLIGGPTDEGDAVRAAFANVRDATRCALHLRHAAQNPIENRDRIYILRPRVVLDFGEFLKTEDNRIKGLEQILVQRLDHAVPPGEIWATEAFVDVARHVGFKHGVKFEFVGPQTLDKGTGQQPCYALKLSDDA